MRYKIYLTPMHQRKLTKGNETSGGLPVKITSVIIIVCGLPGSGKSFFAAKLARMLNSGYVNSDAVRKQLVAEKTYSDKEKLAVYDAMLEQMNLFTNQNKNVVF